MRHWRLATFAVIVLVDTAIWASIDGWVVGFLVVISWYPIYILCGVFVSWFARKVDPWKGTAPGDRVGPISVYPPRATGEPLSDSISPTPPTGKGEDSTSS
jgi:hypothetical protein